MVVGYKVITPLKFCKHYNEPKCKIIGNQMQNAVAMGPPQFLIIQIIASHVKIKLITSNIS
jgi:hypothetical protein